MRNIFQLCAHAHHCLIDNYYRRFIQSSVPPVCASAIAVPRKVLEEIGGFTNMEFLGEDLDTWLRIALKYPIAWSSKPLAIYHQDAANRTHGFKHWLQEPAVSRTARRAIAQGLVPNEAVQDLRDLAAKSQLSAAGGCLIQGKKEVALQLLVYARHTRRFARIWWKWRLLSALPGNPSPWLFKLHQQVKKRMRRWRLLLGATIDKRPAPK